LMQLEIFTWLYTLSFAFDHDQIMGLRSSSKLYIKT